jgi:hypothetical protein
MVGAANECAGAMMKSDDDDDDQLAMSKLSEPTDETTSHANVFADERVARRDAREARCRESVTRLMHELATIARERAADESYASLDEAWTAQTTAAQNAALAARRAASELHAARRAYRTAMRTLSRVLESRVGAARMTELTDAIWRLAATRSSEAPLRRRQAYTLMYALPRRYCRTAQALKEALRARDTNNARFTNATFVEAIEPFDDALRALRIQVSVGLGDDRRAFGAASLSRWPDDPVRDELSDSEFEDDDDDDADADER